VTGTWAKLALLWLIASQVIFLVDVRTPAGAAWTSPFGSLSAVTARIPDALRVHEATGEPGLLLSWVAQLAVAVVAGAGAARAGLAVFRLLGWRRGGTLAILVSPPAGILLLAAAIQGAGLCGLVRPPVAAIALAVLALNGLRALPALGRAGARALALADASVRVSRDRKTRRDYLPAAALALAAALAGLPAIAPERSADALIYHLPVPCSWLEAGRIVARPDWAFAHLTQAQELLVYAGLAVRFDERWGKLASLLAAGWLALLVAHRARRADGRSGIWFAVLVLTAPLLAELAGCGKNDALFACAVFAGFLALERAVGRQEPPTVGVSPDGETPPRPCLAAVAAAGLLFGSAYAIKNFGVFAVAAAAAVLAASPALRRRTAAWAAIGLPPALAALPYVARNWLTMGSPAYPFLLSVWTPVGWTAGKLEMMGVVFNARAFPVGGAGALLASPLHALTHASPFLLAFLPVALVSGAVRSAHRPGLVFLGAWFAGWAILPTGGVVRFLLPLLPVACVVAAAAADGMRGPARRLASALLAAAVVVQAVATLAGPAWESAPLGPAFGREGLAAFRARTAPVFSETLGWLAGEHGVAAVIGQGVQYPRPGTARLLAREIENAPPGWELVRSSRNEGELAKRFRQRRIGLVVYNLTAAGFWAKYAEKFPWSPRDIAVYRRFWLARARLVRVSSTWSAEEGLILLYRVDATPVPASAGTGRARPRAHLFLPGTEAVFSGFRQAFFDGRGGAELEEILAPYRNALEGILAVPARDALVDLAAGRLAAAAGRVRALWPRLDPLEVAVGRLCGVPEGPRPPALERWLAANWPPQRARSADLAALLFNMGLPPALPPR